jgi:hypothetical protein
MTEHALRLEALRLAIGLATTAASAGVHVGNPIDTAEEFYQFLVKSDGKTELSA